VGRHCPNPNSQPGGCPARPGRRPEWSDRAERISHARGLEPVVDHETSHLDRPVRLEVPVVGGTVRIDRFLVFRARCNFRAIALIDIPSARCSRRISAHSSTKITSQIVGGRGSNFTRPVTVSFQASSTVRTPWCLPASGI
jgi:hypothetical protein